MQGVLPELNLASACYIAVRNVWWTIMRIKEKAWHFFIKYISLYYSHKRMKLIVSVRETEANGGLLYWLIISSGPYRATLRFRAVRLFFFEKTFFTCFHQGPLSPHLLPLQGFKTEDWQLTVTAWTADPPLGDARRPLSVTNQISSDCKTETDHYSLGNI